MKVIFLDIDGVLNAIDTKERWQGFIGMNPVLVDRFNRLVEDTSAEVVLSSTWRHASNWRETMKKNGLNMKFLDRTIRMPGKIRGLEIKEWLDRNEVEKYVILDDDTDMLPDQPLFKTSYLEGGLTDRICDSVKHFLLM
ncbi:MAG: HAD domain-containing protein [Patescibacteria group bacterium]|nr:HAD domain-containing protein [Patescibacteria group bacterium]